MAYADHVWQHAHPIYQSILAHPFNQELAQGTLAKDRFNYYIIQDAHYLSIFAKAIALVAAKLSLREEIVILHDFIQGALVAEQQVHTHFVPEVHERQSGRSPACLSYCHYLLSQCALQPAEIGVAALLPCFWIYQKVGAHILQICSADNPYQRWIGTYTSEDFKQAVDRMLAIFNRLANEASEGTRLGMRQAFYESSMLEWHFWNDAYAGRRIEDGMIL
jgi:thiaminase/transcriptional activator TenA